MSGSRRRRLRPWYSTGRECTTALCLKRNNSESYSQQLVVEDKLKAIFLIHICSAARRICASNSIKTSKNQIKIHQRNWPLHPSHGGEPED